MSDTAAVPEGMVDQDPTLGDVVDRVERCLAAGSGGRCGEAAFGGNMTSFRPTWTTRALAWIYQIPPRRLGITLSGAMAGGGYGHTT